MGKFEKKVVIVTGASSGIGEATAIDFAKQGAKLVITGRNKERLTAAAKKCKAAGAEVYEFIGDLADFKNLEKMIKESVKKYGGIDILINNAGFGDMKPIEHVDVETYDKLFQSNVRAPVFLCKYALPYLKKSKVHYLRCGVGLRTKPTGCIVNVSSCAALGAMPNSVPYSMTKAALDHFTRGFSSECAPFGVRVNSINPAVVMTRFADNLGVSDEMKQKALQAFKVKQPLGFITSEQISEGILFLCASEMTTGVSLPIDGGLLHSTGMPADPK